MSERNGSAMRPSAILSIGLVIAAALALSGCGGSSAATTTSNPATSPTTGTTTATSTASTTSTSSASSGVSGAWLGQYSGAYSGTFNLHWQASGSSLSGTIKLSPGGTVPVHGTVVGSAIKFGTVGGPGITYTGSVSGDSMSGTYTTPSGGGSWSAHKTS